MLFSGKNNITSEHRLDESKGDAIMRLLKDLRAAVREYGVRCAPQLGIDLWKDGVAQLNCFQFLEFFRRKLASPFKATPRVQQRTELLQMSIEALLRIVACGFGGDQKLPVRRLQQQLFAANLFYQPRSGFIAAPKIAMDHLLHCQLSGINMLPSPCGVVIQPDAVIALRAPRSLRQGHIRGWRKLIKIVSAGNQLDSRFRLGKFQCYILQPFRTFKPPVPKELCIKWRSQNRGSSAIFAVTLQRLCGDADKMLGVFARTLQRNRRIIWLLQTQIRFCASDPPISISAGPALFVK